MSVINLTITWESVNPNNHIVTIVDLATVTEYYNGFMNGAAPGSLDISLIQLLNVFAIPSFIAAAQNPLPEACVNLVQYNVVIGPAPAGGINLRVVSPPSGPIINLPVTTTGPIQAGIDYDPAVGTNEWSSSYCCIHANSLVRTFEGEKSISDVHSGEQVVDHRGLPLTVKKVVKFCVPSRQFIKLAENSLAESSPSKDLLIVGNHPILVGGYSVEPFQLVNGYSVVEVDLQDKPATVYTLITQEQAWFRVQGVDVATWSEAAWERHVKERHLVVQYQ